MNHNLKVLVLALFAAMALSAVAATAASADHLVAGEEAVDITAEGTKAFGTTFGTKSSSLTVECEKEKFTGTAKNGATEITVHPEYSGCRAEPFGSSPVDTTGCNYILTGTTEKKATTSGVETKTDATVKMDCTAGNSIKITAPGCTITVPQTENEDLWGVTYDNENTGKGNTEDVKVTVTVDNIHYTTPGGFVCSLGGLSTSGNDSFLTGSATTKGYKDGSKHEAADQRGIQIASP